MYDGIGYAWGFRRQVVIRFIMAAVAVLLLASASVTFAQCLNNDDTMCGGNYRCIEVLEEFGNANSGIRVLSMVIYLVRVSSEDQRLH